MERHERLAGGGPAKLATALVQLAGRDEPRLRWVAAADAVEQKANDMLAPVDAHRVVSSPLTHRGPAGCCIRSSGGSALAGGLKAPPAVRLFSITGVGNAAEQERRATSTLLSTMMAVREFGRALVTRFGGPAGAIETYLEVPFTLDDRTSIPDRGDPRGPWRADLDGLVGGQDRYQCAANEQIERYLDMGRQQGYDAVITLSNDLAPVGGTHPVNIDGRKVGLHRISWSEVLHEAQIQRVSVNTLAIRRGCPGVR